MEHDANLILHLLNETTAAEAWVQAGIILLALALAWLVTRQLIGRLTTRVREDWHADEWRRFMVPLLAQLVVLVAQPALAHWQTIFVLQLAQPLLLSMFIIQLSFFLLRSISHPGPGLRSVERIVSWLVWGVVALHITGYLAVLIETLDAVGFSVGKGRLSLYTAIIGLLSIAGTLVVALSVGRLIEARLMRAGQLKLNTKVVLSKLVKTVLIVLAVLIVLPIVGIDITVLSVFGGALGVGLGFGLQKIASNYVSGFTLLLDNSIRIGDMVTVNNRFGEVKEIATRYTVIRSQDGTEYIIPNETLVTTPVINHTLASSENRVVLPIQVAYGSDLDKVRAILLAAARQPRVLPEPPPRVNLSGFGDNGINMELRFWISDPDAGTGALKSDINWAIWQDFQREGIEIPFPQRVVQMLPPRP
jgi:small-conductance mechanosensitive channel